MSLIAPPIQHGINRTIQDKQTAISPPFLKVNALLCKVLAESTHDSFKKPFNRLRLYEHD